MRHAAEPTRREENFGFVIAVYAWGDPDAPVLSPTRIARDLRPKDAALTFARQVSAGPNFPNRLQSAPAKRPGWRAALLVSPEAVASPVRGALALSPDSSVQ